MSKAAVDQLLTRLKQDFTEVKFQRGRKFAFRPPGTIVVGPDEERADLLLLHEVGHAVLGHRDFTSDAGRLKLEVAAWAKARALAEQYAVPWDEELAQAQLDSYRDWLHRRARCPQCGLTRYQTPDKAWHCPRCENFC